MSWENCILFIPIRGMDQQNSSPEKITTLPAWWSHHFGKLH